jgi:hypothetical protein
MDFAESLKTYENRISEKWTSFDENSIERNERFAREPEFCDKFHQEAHMNVTNGICSGSQAFSSERLTIIAESSDIVVKQFRRQNVGKDARR